MVHHFDVTPCTRSYKRGVALTLHKLLISAGVELRFAELVYQLVPCQRCRTFGRTHTFDLDIKKDLHGLLENASSVRVEIFSCTLLSLDRIIYDHELSIRIRV